MVAAGPGGARDAVGGAESGIDGREEAPEEVCCFAEAASVFGFAFGAGLLCSGVGFGFGAGLLCSGFGAAGATGLTGFAVRGGFSGFCAGGAAVIRRVRRCPGRIRFGSAPTVARLVSYSACQPPSTCWSVAIADRESPGATTYGFGSTDVPVGRGAVFGVAAPSCGSFAVTCTFVGWGAGVRALAGCGFADCVCGVTAGAGPLRLSPAAGPHEGQACGPCPLRTFSATAICWALVARSARGA